MIRALETKTLLLIAAAAFLAGSPSATAQTSCLTCHGDADLFEEEQVAIVAGFEADIHARVGLSCHDCHGGNPDPELAEDFEAAMSEAWEPNPYRGPPAPTEEPSWCGRCHSDPVYMKRFRPDARVDQEREYWTSQHGQALAAGDEEVATCSDCHGVHGILEAGDPGSSVYPTRLAETCRGCHEDAERMAGYTLPDGRALPIDQYVRWRKSVHAVALLDREDLSAPTCNDCHGNHGATPPGLDSVAFVCGQCHGREAEIFRRSSKLAGFRRHNEYLAEAEGEGCALCHELADAEAAQLAFTSFGECAACHGNHAVVRPTMGLLSPLPETPCGFCHEGVDSIDRDHPEPRGVEKRYAQVKEELLAEAAAQGLAGDELFDWLVDRAWSLPGHGSAEGTSRLEDAQPRAEFRRLFTKFRIGKTSFTFEDPATGGSVRAPLLGCALCHGAATEAAEDSAGLQVAAGLLGSMHELTAKTARAERILLAARRGGVETRPALLEIDQAVDAQIELEVLVHGFSVDETGPFAAKQLEGLEHAEAALVAGDEALDELAYRRRGLAVALGIIGLVLVGLALKIRELSSAPTRA